MAKRNQRVVLPHVTDTNTKTLIAFKLHHVILNGPLEQAKVRMRVGFCVDPGFVFFQLAEADANHIRNCSVFLVLANKFYNF